MMVATILSKRFKDIGARYLLVLFTSFWLFGARSDGLESPLPSLDYLGVIPMQLVGDASDSKIKGHLELVQRLFSRFIRETNRFRVLDDRLISQMWADSSSRKELRKEYELSCFSHLNLDVRDDSVILTARLLGPELQPFIQESEVHSRTFFRTAKVKDLQLIMQNLTFRLINRIPIDVTITSVQGRYVTLSGGIKQGLYPGDQIDLVRVFVKSTHPVLHTWRSFESRPLGRAIVVDSSDRVATARLTQLIRKDSVRIGDGARSREIASRALFSATDRRLEQSGGEDGILLNGSVGAGGVGISDAYKGNGNVARPALPSGLAKKGNRLQKEHDKPVVEWQKSAGAGSIVGQDPGDLLLALADGLSVDVSQKGFSYSGPGASGSRMSWYLPANALGAELGRRLLSGVQYKIGGGLHFGKTQENTGSYLGYSAHARFFWEDQLALFDGGIRQWMLGAHASVTGLGVSSEGFGGYDLLRGGIVAGLKGDLDFGHRTLRWDWFAELSMVPLTLGRIGYGGSGHLVRSAFGWELALGAYARRKAMLQAEWGGGLSYGSYHTFDDADHSTLLKFYSLSVLARWEL